MLQLLQPATSGTLFKLSAKHAHCLYIVAVCRAGVTFTKNAMDNPVALWRAYRQQQRLQTFVVKPCSLVSQMSKKLSGAVGML
jgi:hypothetical protein